MNFRKKPVVVEATQWFKDGDHPEVRVLDNAEANALPHWVQDDLIDLPSLPSGQVYGVIGTLEGTHIVTPGDWIITGVAGERYPCNPAIFEATYEPAAADTHFTRMEAEHAALRARHDGLEHFINSPEFSGVDAPEQARLIAQRDAMREYGRILTKRLRAAIANGDAL